MAFRKGKRKGERGAALVEFALVSLIFLSLLLSILDLALLAWVDLTMQHAVREGVRYAVTGRKDLDPNPDPLAKMRKTAVINKIEESSFGLSEKYCDPISQDFGARGDIIVVSLNCQWPLLTPILQPFFDEGKYRFSASATMKNEAF